MIGIYGAGGFGREVAAMLPTAIDKERVVCFVDDCRTGRCAGYPVFSLKEAIHEWADLGIVVAIGDGQRRREIGARLKDRLRTVRSVPVWCGPGSIICPGAVLTTDITIGTGVVVNIGATIGHDCILRDWSSIMPGVNLTGYVDVGEEAYVGIGATVVCRTPGKHLRIGRRAVVGAGAVVLHDVPDGVTVVGCPATPLQVKS